MHDVTSWFIDQLLKPSSSPKRTFTIANSDYSDFVLKWPKIKKESDKIISAGVKIDLDNTDGAFNLFFENTYNMVSSCQLKIGFTHSNSGDELITLYTGNLGDVKYSKSKCQVKLKDTLFDLRNKNISDTQTPTDFTTVIPSDIAWTLCTCYGELSTVQSTSNININYSSFLIWAGQFSADSITMTAHYKGEKVIDAISRLAKMTDSAIWTDGDGKIKFYKFSEMSSNFATVNEGENKTIDLDVSKLEVGDSISIADLSLENITFVGDLEQPIVSVLIPKIKEEIVEEAEEVVEEGEAEAKEEESSEDESKG